MPTIEARKQADGSLRYTAVVRIRRQGKVHRKARPYSGTNERISAQLQAYWLNFLRTENPRFGTVAAR